jgi:hypothetical protein
VRDAASDTLVLADGFSCRTQCTAVITPGTDQPQPVTTVGS